MYIQSQNFQLTKNRSDKNNFSADSICIIWCDFSLIRLPPPPCIPYVYMYITYSNVYLITDNSCTLLIGISIRFAEKCQNTRKENTKFVCRGAQYFKHTNLS